MNPKVQTPKYLLFQVKSSLSCHMRPLLLGHPTILPAVPVNCAEKRRKYATVTIFLPAVVMVMCNTAPGLNPRHELQKLRFSDNCPKCMHLFSNASALFLMFMELCIANVFFPVYQQHATLYNILYYCQCSTFQAVSLPIIRSSKLHTQYLLYVKLACCYR